MENNIATTIGYLDTSRLKQIPDKYHAKHEFLIFVFEQLQTMILRTQDHADRSSKSNPSQIVGFDNDAFQADPIAYLAKHCPEARVATLNNILLALMGDFLNFVNTALLAFEERKFAVGYANLRKPLKENLLLLCWASVDEDDFYSGFLEDPVSQLNVFTKDKFEELLQKASDRGIAFGDIPVDAVVKAIYDRSYEHGLFQYFDKATHLITSHKKMKIEDFNLNFIFKDPRTNDVYSNGYDMVAFSLLFATKVIRTICDKMHPYSSNHNSWLDTALWGSFQAIYQGKTSELISILEKTIEELFQCSHCQSKIELPLNQIPSILMLEVATCTKCGEQFPFPFYWLVNHTKKN